MRVASFHQLSNVQLNINKLQQQQAIQQFQISTGKAFNKASESPVKANQAAIIKEAINKIDQYQSNVNDAKGILETSVTALESAYGVLEEVNNEVLKALNGTYNQEDMDIIATTIDNAIGHLVSVGNTKHLNRYVFSGERILTKPFDFDGANVTYNGNDNEMKISVSPYIETSVVSSGNLTFTDMIQNLVTMRDQINAGDRTGLAASHATHLDYMDSTTTNISNIGVKLNSLNTVNEGFIAQKQSLEEKRSNVEEVDFAEVIVQYSATQTAYSATLKATSMMFDSSILNYI